MYRRTSTADSVHSIGKFEAVHATMYMDKKKKKKKKKKERKKKTYGQLQVPQCKKLILCCSKPMLIFASPNLMTLEFPEQKIDMGKRNHNWVPSGQR